MVTPTNRTSSKMVTRMIKNVVIYASRPEEGAARTGIYGRYDRPEASRSAQYSERTKSTALPFLK